MQLLGEIGYGTRVSHEHFGNVALSPLDTGDEIFMIWTQGTIN